MKHLFCRDMCIFCTVFYKFVKTVHRTSDRSSPTHPQPFYLIRRQHVISILVCRLDKIEQIEFETTRCSPIFWETAGWGERRWWFLTTSPADSTRCDIKEKCTKNVKNDTVTIWFSKVLTLQFKTHMTIIKRNPWQRILNQLSCPFFLSLKKKRHTTVLNTT